MIMARRKSAASKKKPMKNYFRVISDPRSIRKAIGFHTPNPKPICNQCLKRVKKVTHDRGAKIAKKLGVERFNLLGYWCDTHLHFFNLLPVLQPDLDKCIDAGHKRHSITIDRGKKIAEEANIDRFDKIGDYCYECKRFDKTKTRRVKVELKEKIGV